LAALGLTLFGRFVYLRFSLRRDEPLWSQRVLVIAGIVGIVCVAVIAAGGTANGAR
jgi:cell shape-determining protein MreD